jgi:hypothetical protein
MDQEIQEVASCILLPPKHHKGTHSVYPIGEDTSHEKL